MDDKTYRLGKKSVVPGPLKPINQTMRRRLLRDQALRAKLAAPARVSRL